MYHKEFSLLHSIKCILYTNFLGIICGFFWHLYTIIALNPFYFNNEKSCYRAIQVYEFSGMLSQWSVADTFIFLGYEYDLLSLCSWCKR